jgi:hypothetical protein
MFEDRARSPETVSEEFSRMQNSSRSYSFVRYGGLKMAVCKSNVRQCFQFMLVYLECV